MMDNDPDEYLYCRRALLIAFAICFVLFWGVVLCGAGWVFVWVFG